MFHALPTQRVKSERGGGGALGDNASWGKHVVCSMLEMDQNKNNNRKRSGGWVVLLMLDDQDDVTQEELRKSSLST